MTSEGKEQDERDLDHADQHLGERHAEQRNHVDAALLRRLRLAQVLVTSNVSLSFQAVSSRTYSVVYKDALTSSGWLKLTNVPAQPVSQTISVVDPVLGTQTRFYRLVTPAILP